jgi:hypothetical protein
LSTLHYEVCDKESHPRWRYPWYGSVELAAPLSCAIECCGPSYLLANDRRGSSKGPIQGEGDVDTSTGEDSRAPRDAVGRREISGNRGHCVSQFFISSFLFQKSRFQVFGIHPNSPFVSALSQRRLRTSYGRRQGCGTFQPPEIFIFILKIEISIENCKIQRSKKKG